MKPAKRVIEVLGIERNFEEVLEALKSNTDCEINSIAMVSTNLDEDCKKSLGTKIVISKSTSILICGIYDVLSLHNYLCAEKRVRNALRNQGKRVCVVAESDSSSVDQMGLDWNLSYALGCAEYCRPGVYVVKQSRCYNQGAYDAKSF